jgi:prepilin-type N-terminal cleavage/methylation domain-containing protein
MKIVVDPVCPLLDRSKISPRRQDRAFTLVELVIVMGIAGIVATIVAVVSVQSTEPIKLKAALEKLESDIRYAQRLAMSQGLPCGVSFDTSAGAYFVFIGDTSNKAVDRITGEIVSVDYHEDGRYRGVNLLGTNFGDQISFDFTGAPYDSAILPLSEPGTVTLQLGDRSGTVRIGTQAGIIRVQ